MLWNIDKVFKLWAALSMPWLFMWLYTFQNCLHSRTSMSWWCQCCDIDIIVTASSFCNSCYAKQHTISHTFILNVCTLMVNGPLSWIVIMIICFGCILLTSYITSIHEKVFTTSDILTNNFCNQHWTFLQNVRLFNHE